MSAPVQSVAIVHYHLRPAGVTRVITHAASVLRQHGVRVVVLCGEAPDAGVDIAGDVVVLDGLGYDETRATWSADELARRLRGAADDALGAEPDLWHVHNHSLGKNVALPGAVRAIAEAGRHVLLQPHDFAEDGRPSNYTKMLEHFDDDSAALGAALWPVADHVHYATLNRRDHRHLVGAGVPESRVHLLPNAVDLKVDESDDRVIEHEVGRFFLYPTRAIRRKNIGELLLWSALGEPGDLFATTLAPTSPADMPIYEGWKRFAAERALPMRFEAGTKSDASFIALLRSADALVTTSVAEGFGMAFLEPWLVGRPLVGRDLPAITADFVEQGVDLDALYTRLDVPMEWAGGGEAVRGRIAEKLRETYSAYRQMLDDLVVEATMRSIAQEDRVDFGRLDEPLQQRVIAALIADGAARSEVRPPVLAGEGATDTTRVTENQRIVRERYGLDAYGERLLEIYGDVVESSVSRVGGVSAEDVLRRFLGPDEFNLLRT